MGNNLEGVISFEDIPHPSHRDATQMMQRWGMARGILPLLPPAVFRALKGSGGLLRSHEVVDIVR